MQGNAQYDILLETAFFRSVLSVLWALLIVSKGTQVKDSPSSLHQATIYCQSLQDISYSSFLVPSSLYFQYHCLYRLPYFAFNYKRSIKCSKSIRMGGRWRRLVSSPAHWYDFSLTSVKDGHLYPSQTICFNKADTQTASFNHISFFILHLRAAVVTQCIIVRPVW